MPVDVGQIARQGGCQHKREVVDRRAVPQLADAEVAREILDDESRGEGDDHAGADTEDAAGDDQTDDAAQEETRHAGQKEDRKSGGEDFEFAAPFGELPGEQHEGDDEQRGERREHLDFEVGDLREDPVQVTQNRGDGQSGERRDGRHGPDGQQNGKRDEAFSGFDFHVRRFWHTPCKCRTETGSGPVADCRADRPGLPPISRPPREGFRRRAVRRFGRAT